MWDLPGSGIKPTSLALAAEFFTARPPGKPPYPFLIILWEENKGNYWNCYHGKEQTHHLVTLRNEGLIQRILREPEKYLMLALEVWGCYSSILSFERLLSPLYDFSLHNIHWTICFSEFLSSNLWKGNLFGRTQYFMSGYTRNTKDYQLVSRGSGDLSLLTQFPSSVLQSKGLWLSQFHLEEVRCLFTVVDMSSKHIHVG